MQNESCELNDTSAALSAFAETKQHINQRIHVIITRRYYLVGANLLDQSDAINKDLLELFSLKNALHSATSAIDIALGNTSPSHKFETINTTQAYKDSEELYEKLSDLITITRTKWETVSNQYLNRLNLFFSKDIPSKLQLASVDEHHESKCVLM